MTDALFADLPAAIRTRLTQGAGERTHASLCAAAAMLSPSLYDGPIPLQHRAIQVRDIALLTTILALGAPPDLDDAEGWTPLHCAAAQEDATAVAILLAAGANPRATIPCGPLAGWTPLHLVAHAGRPTSGDAIAILLLTAGADPGAVAADGTTPQGLQALAVEQGDCQPC